MKIVNRSREEVIKLWVKALRSGEYKQTKKVLKQGNGFCCLGVLCDLAAKDGGAQWSKGDGTRQHERYNGHFGTLPKNIHEFIFDGHWNYENKLVYMNDSGDTFEKIANRIEIDLLNN